MLKLLFLLVAVFSCCSGPIHGDESNVPETGAARPLTKSEVAAIEAQYKNVLMSVARPMPGESGATNAHSVRGDALFFLGRFKDAVEEYELMVTLDPELDSSHWRLGIAYFYADQPAQAVAQFEKYRSFDDVDRENGIWRYLSQFKATDSATAKKELIRYQKDDRQPFPTVYKLFDDSVTPKEALLSIPTDISASDRDARLFYTELYIGMHLVVKGQTTDAKTYLQRSVSRKWPRTAGYGPNYMWHVGRVQLDLLNKTPKPKSAAAP